MQILHYLSYDCKILFGVLFVSNSIHLLDKKTSGLDDLSSKYRGHTLNVCKLNVCKKYFIYVSKASFQRYPLL